MMTQRLKSLMSGLAALTLAALMPAGAQAGILEQVQERGYLRCGVNTGVLGFAMADPSGDWVGMDADLCRAIAAATLGDQTAVEFIPLTARNRFQAVQSGRVDVLARNTTWNFERDVTLGLNFAAVYFFDETVVMVPADSGITGIQQLVDRTVCVISGAPAGNQLQAIAAQSSTVFSLVPVGSTEEARLAYTEGRCIAFANDHTVVAALRASFENTDDHIILPNRLGRAPLGLAVRHGDDRWEDIVRWVFNALVIAEFSDITQDNVADRRETTRHPTGRYVLGVDGNSGEQLGLEANWAYWAIRAVGNYGEIYERSFGPDSLLPIDRGLNELWTEGGILMVPPFY